MASHIATSYGPQIAQVNEELLLTSSLDLTMMQHLMMKILNLERCAFILKLKPLELGIIIFLQTLAPWSFCCKSISLQVMNSKPSMKVVTKLKIFLSLHGLQFLALDTIVGCAI